MVRVKEIGSLALLAKGVEIDAKNNSGKTALMLSAGNGHTDIAKALLDAGADVEAKDNEGVTAIEFARQSDSGKLVKLLRGDGCQRNKYKAN